MASEFFFSKLKETVSVLNKVPDLELRAKTALNRDDKEERNILQCPEESLKSVAEMRQSVKDEISGLMKVHSHLRMIGIENAKLLSNAEAILTYAEAETEKMEMYLKEKHGVVPLSEKESNISISKRLSSLGGRGPTDILLLRESNAKRINNTSDTSVPPASESIQEEKKDSLLVMPRSPDIKKFVPSYQEKDIGRISMPSPESPSNGCVNGRGIMGYKYEAKTEPLQPLDGVSDNPPPPLGRLDGILDRMASPKTPTLETAYFGHKQNHNNHHESSDSLSSSLKFFKTPCAKGARETNHESESGMHPGADVESPGPGFTLHSRRSVLANVPEAKESIDDDTVLLLGGRRMHGANMVTPDSPELTQVRTLPTIQPRELNSYFHRPELGGGCPMTPPSPHLKFDINNPEAEEKENLGPGVEASSAYEVSEKQYQLLPEYLKRLIPLTITNECLGKVLETTFALPGEKYPKVTTETKIAEATGLGPKTKSFTFLLISLKIIHKIVGTEYFEVFG